MTLMTMMLAATAQLVTVDPGHFHAALVQNRTYPEVANEVHVFAPDGPELESHLKLIESFNTRKENPTAWKETVTRGDDYLEKFVAAAKTGKLGRNPIVILAGKNNRKGDYALAAVEAGCNVLSDKPMAITPEVYAKTERAARLAQEKGLFFADIMTERNEITTILQRELVLDHDLYGEQERGTPDDPAVVKESVHHFCKLVNGAPLKRPEWYYDTKVQGAGLTDVTTHLVDIVQWVMFPDERLDKGDVKIMSARTWPTMITPEQFKLSTGGSVEKTFACESNGEFVWRLKDVHCKVSVVWNFMAPKGTGDTHYSLLRGTKAEIFIRQGEKENYKPVLYVRARQDAAATEKALAAAVARIAKARPGVTAVPAGEAGLWRIAYPKAYDIGHEAHFSQVVRTYLDWMKQGKEDPIYIDNMIVKYFTIEEAWRMAKATKPVTVKVDWEKSAGPVKPVNGVGQGPILGWNGFSMFHYLKEAGTPILRYHDVGGAFGGNRFVDIPNIFRGFDADENDPKSYDFGFTDQLVDATVKNGMEPFFRLGVTIENHPEVNVYRILPPKDFAKWARVCEHVIRHYNEGWANGRRYGIRYWEIWNEPDDMPDLRNQSFMWRGEFADYIRLYDVTARHLKKCFPDIKVGGYASCGFYAATEAKPSRRSQAYVDRFREFLKFVKENGTPIDFFSYHSYAERPEEILKQACFARRTLDEFGFRGLETSLNEWHSGAWLKDRGTAAHAARQAANLLAMQNGPVDTAMFYDARVGTSCYGGLFDPMVLKPLKAYWGFRAFNELKMRQNEVFSACAEPGVYVCAARGSEDGAVMVVNLNEKGVSFAPDFGGREILGVRMTDATRDFAPCAVPKDLPPQSIAVFTVKMTEPLRDAAGDAYLFRRGDRGIASYRIPAVATAKDGTLIAVCDERHVHAGDLHEVHPINVVCRRSTDNGRTWSPTKPTWVWPWTDPKKYKWDPHERWGASDPSLVADPKSGKVFLLYNVMEHVKGQGKYLKYVQESSDAGLTWSTPRDITAAVGTEGFITSGRGCCLRDGTLAAVLTYPTEEGRKGYVIGSRDGGRTWGRLSSVVSPADESKLAELPDGSWYVNSRIPGKRKELCRAVHVSKDGGKTWETRLDTGLRDPHCNGAVLADGDILWFTNCDAENRTNAMLKKSADGGRSWTKVVTLTSGPAAYSDLTKTADGKLLLVWEDDRGSILFRTGF